MKGDSIVGSTTSVQYRFANTLFIKVLLWIGLIMYVPGLVLYALDPQPFYDKFTITTGPFVAFLLVGAIFLLILAVLMRCCWRLSINIKRKMKPDYLTFFFLCVSFIYLFCSVYFFIFFDISFRHVSSLSEGGPVVAIQFFVKYFGDLFLLFSVIQTASGHRLGFYSRATLLVFCIGNALSLNGALQVAFFLISWIVLFRPELFNRSLTPKSFMNFGIYFIALLSGVSVILVGYAAKVDGPVFTISFIEFLWESRDELYYRFAVSLFSLAKQFESISNMFSLSVDVLEGLSEVFINRISIIMTGTGSNLTEINTIERFNFLSLFKDYHPRAGASPGFLASMFYFPFFPFGFLALPFFYVVMSKVFANLLPSRFRFNIIFLSAVGYCTLFMFESPLTVLYGIEPIAFALIGMVFFSCFFNVRFALTR